MWLAGYRDPEWDIHTALFKGLTSVRSGGVHIFSESCYFNTDAGYIQEEYKAAWTFGCEHAGDPAFWRDKCSVAMGTMPIWRTADRMLSPTEVLTQLRNFASVEPRPRYRWFYTGSTTPYEDPEYAGYQEALRNR